MNHRLTHRINNQSLSVSHDSYYDEDGNGILRNPFMHLWSLGVEEQVKLGYTLIPAVWCRCTAHVCGPFRLCV